MKNFIICALAFAALVALMAFDSGKATNAIENPGHTAGQFEPVAVLELFTSQGCSSCPAADRLLARTIRNSEKEGKNIFAVSFHVDYWNRLGWPDPFSTKEFTDRQSRYAAQLKLNSVYTPQMIVNGSREFVGSDEAELKEALNQSLKQNTSVSFKKLTAVIGNHAVPEVKFSLDGEYKNCTINFALVSLNETTVIKRGENGGLTLSNEHIVRQFISVPAAAEGMISFKERPLPTVSNTAIVAYIQNNNFKIIGAQKADIK